VENGFDASTSGVAAISPARDKRKERQTLKKMKPQFAMNELSLVFKDALKVK
jgi:hypothetical protein